MATTRSPKRTSLRIIEQLEDDVTYEDMLYALYVFQKVERGLEDVRERRTISHKDVRREFAQWLS
ncbi:MAG: hypothetical protein AAF730_00540 [Bacteroidota bacterium]